MMISNDSLQLLKKPSMTVPFLNGPSVRESMVSLCPLALEMYTQSSYIQHSVS